MGTFPDSLKYYIEDFTPESIGENIKVNDNPENYDRWHRSTGKGKKRKADSHTPEHAKRSRVDSTVPPPASSESVDETEASLNGRDENCSSIRRGSSPISREDTISSSTTKDALKASIKRLLPWKQPGLCPNDIQAQLLAQHSELSGNWSSQNGFRSAIAVALKRLLDEGEADRTEAIGPKGGRTYEYVALGKEKLEKTLPHGQTVTQGMEAGNGASNPAYDPPEQVQRPTEVERVQLQAPKQSSEDGVEVTRRSALHPAEIVNKQFSSSCATKRPQPETNTCKQGDPLKKPG